MTDKEFSRKIEWMLHSFIIAYGLSVATAAFATQSINSGSSGTLCTTAPLPTGCRQNPEIFGECDPVLERRASQSTLVSSSTFIVSLLGIVTSMGLICCLVINTLRTPGTAARPPPQKAVKSNNLTFASPVRNSQDQDLEESNVASEGSNRNAERWGQLKKETCVQAISYIMAFLVTYCPLLIYRFVFLDTRTQTPKILLLILHGLFPLSGFLNVLVLTRPKITSLRIRHSEYSWLRAFWYVIKAGGDMPREENEIVVDDTNINGDVASPVRSRAFGVLESPAALPGFASSAILSSGGCLYDGSQSFGTDNVAYRSKELWKYNKNDSGGVSASLGFIPEEEVGQSQDEDGNGVLEALRGGRKETED